MHVSNSNPGKRVLTLGGCDERPLWEAWRDLAKIDKANVGHLYASELREVQQDGKGSAIHMSRTNLGWSARQDIERTLLLDLKSGPGSEGKEGSIGLNRLFGWCLNGCVCLPTFLNGTACNLTLDGQPTTCDELKQFDSSVLAKAAAGWIDRWVL